MADTIDIRLPHDVHDILQDGPAARPDHWS
jgi:hypothetical protein